MSVGNFKDSNETNDINETTENIDNSEKKRNQILETPESYDDDFDSKLDNNKHENENNKDSSQHENGEKTGILDKMRNLFSKKESGEKPTFIENEDKEQEKGENNRRNSFRDDLRKDVPSMEEQAEKAKELPGREDYLEARKKSEQAKSDYPDLKDWELSPEQLKDVHQNQSEVANKVTDGESEEKNRTPDEARTPGGDAWERRFGNIENE